MGGATVLCTCHRFAKLTALTRQKLGGQLRVNRPRAKQARRICLTAVSLQVMNTEQMIFSPPHFPKAALDPFWHSECCVRFLEIKSCGYIAVLKCTAVALLHCQCSAGCFIKGERSFCFLHFHYVTLKNVKEKKHEDSPCLKPSGFVI